MEEKLKSTSRTTKVVDFVNPSKQSRDTMSNIRQLSTDKEIEKTNFSLPRKKRSIVDRLTRQGKAKVYRLKGYTSVGHVKSLRKRDELKVKMIKTILILAGIVGIIVIFILLKPFVLLAELKRAFGY